MKRRLLLLEYDLVSPGRGLGKLKFCIIFAAFIKSGERLHLLCVLATRHSKNNSAKRPKSVIWVFCQ